MNLIRALDDFIAKLIAIFTSVYVTFMFLKILGIIQEPKISEPINILIIALIVLYFALYITYKIYKWAESRDKRLWE
jgi:quinol-cytochrome oxidoreductase complex cytochrome b subunit